ncbi:MAG: DUF2157 domain-containing protein [Syntrophotaleaceae bacterium]
MTSHRKKLIELFEQGAIPVEKIDQALTVMKVFPDSPAWRRFIDQLLLWLGSLALAFSLLFFIAYNWSEIGRFAKFGMIEAAIVLCIAAYCRFGDSMPGKAALLAATICLGVLLAFFGQTYQTGADPWQLFFTWALLMLPWAIIARFPAVWIVWVALLNISLILYHQTFRGVFLAGFDSEIELLWLLFIFNMLAHLAWEFLARLRPWLAERWAIRLLAIGAGVPLTWLVLHAIFEGMGKYFLSALIWTAWLATMLYLYRRIIPDLFMLAGCCLAGITVSITFLGRFILDDSSGGGFLLLALAVIGMGAGAAVWLKQVHRDFQS